MNLKTWLWVITSLVFECLGDVAAKTSHWIWAVVAYNLMLVTWLKTVQSAGQLITVPGTVWCLGGEAILVVLGVFYFREHLNVYQWTGVFLAFIAILLMAKEG